MKKHKYILLFSVFVLGFLISDRIIAQWLNSILYSVSSGTHAEARIAMYEQKSEILILGSSRAQSHFDPLAITKVTGLSCYNAGMVSQGYDYTEIITSVMLKRYSPEFVVIEVTPTFFDESIYNIANAILLPFAYDEKSILNFRTGR
ncbi:MAG: hypothetical protein IPN18_19195 [Ignavibacteriales bacterium]|nr:hypothetical protein [Ignavibacteriales bacterium]